MSLQQKIHDPVKAVCTLREFSWTKAKLKLIDELLDQMQKHMTHFTLFLSKVELKDGKHYYQDIKLPKYKGLIKAVNNHYCKTIVSIPDNKKSRFEDLKQYPVFENMVSLLETQTWPTENTNEFGDKEIIKIANHFRDLLSKNGCSLNVINEWQVLKTFMVPLINNKNSTDLELWKRVFLDIETKKECRMCCTYLKYYLSFHLRMPN